MLRPIDEYFLKQDEPARTCLQFLRAYILQQDDDITEAWQYGVPFYCYRGKMFCYLWMHKKYKQPYIGFVEGKRLDHPDLIMEKRVRIKILLLDPDRDLPMHKIDLILNQALSFYQ
ncbi:MAG: DUF1801 domain-containing protein [Chitinophagaceae bacterium]